MGLVYAYGLGVPILLWLGLRYLGVGEWSVVETVALWGYGQFVWIPVSVRLLPLGPLKRILIYLGIVGSLYHSRPHRSMGPCWARLPSLGLLPHF